jgi:hypothetical protein
MPTRRSQSGRPPDWNGSTIGYPSILANRLDETIAVDPNFFVRLLAHVYPAGEARPLEFSEAERKIAEQAFDVLKGWSVVPGIRVDGEIDAEASDRGSRKSSDSPGRRGVLPSSKQDRCDPLEGAGPRKVSRGFPTWSDASYPLYAGQRRAGASSTR